MSEPHANRSDRQYEFLYELLYEHASIDCDVIEIAKGTWAIHGVFPYEGEVLMAVFGTYDEAKHALDEVRGATRPTSAEERSS